MPAAPRSAAPVLIVTMPALPDAVVPVYSCMSPLEPADTALAVSRDSRPLEDDWPAPVTTTNAPPTADVSTVDPAERTTSPPVPLFVVPTTRLMEPARPADTEPDAINT